MAFTINNGALYQLFDRPHMKIAIESCVGVVELWPLQTVQEMENDAKYTEDLQVRFSCTMARAMLRLSYGINPSVAEAVYEGMDVVDTIAQVAVDENQKPTETITINSVSIETYQAQ